GARARVAPAATSRRRSRPMRERSRNRGPRPAAWADPSSGTRRPRAFERLLVAAEPPVAVDAEEGMRRRRDELGRHGAEVDGEPLDDLDQRRAHVRLVLILPRPKPFPVVVALEPAQKAESLRSKGTASTCHGRLMA